MHAFAKCLSLGLSCLAFSSLGLPTVLAQDDIPWLDDQTVAVVKLNSKDASTGQLLAQLREQVPGAGNELKVWQDQLQSIGQSITAAGGEELLVVYSLADDFQHQPYYVVPKAKGLNVAAMQRSFPASGALNPMRQSAKLVSAEVAGATIVGPAEVVSRVKSNKAKVSADIASFVSQPTSSISMLGTLSADQRKALAAMNPLMPASLGGGRSSIFLSQLDWLRVDINGAAPSQFQLTLAGDQTALQSRIKDIEAWIKSSETLPDAPINKTLAEYLIDQLISQPAKVNGRQATWSITIETALKSKLGTALSAAVMRADELSTMQNLKVMALGVHNFYSAHNKFPPVKTRVDGKPRTLSWRVDLLPFIEQGELYNEFHHDEPWDSEHNRQLVSRMPEIYRVPQSKHTASTGLSTFALPVNAQTMWPADKPIDFKDITDGTSNTIMIIEIADDTAQVWTKPEPFELNFDKLLEQVGGHYKGRVFYAAGDGSAQIANTAKLDQLKGQLTRAGGEVIE